MKPAIAQRFKRVTPRFAKDASLAAYRKAMTATAALRPLPEFLIVGTKRGGTTSLWNYLLQHPLIMPMVPAAANMKSNHYYYWHYDQGLNWYRGHFPSVRARQAVARQHSGHQPVTGEASPMYLYDPRVPARVLNDMPNAKIIVLLRDPVERAYSHYKERVRSGVEPLTFEQALEQEDDRLDGERDRLSREPFYYSRPLDYYTYRDRGVYLPQLLRWQESFPAKQIHILQSELFYANPSAAFNQVVEFLGLPSHSLKNAKKYNYRPAAEMEPDTRLRLTKFFAPYNRQLASELKVELPWADG